MYSFKLRYVFFRYGDQTTNTYSSLELIINILALNISSSIYEGRIHVSYQYLFYTVTLFRVISLTKQRQFGQVFVLAVALIHI